MVNCALLIFQSVVILILFCTIPIQMKSGTAINMYVSWPNSFFILPRYSKCNSHFQSAYYPDLIIWKKTQWPQWKCFCFEFWVFIFNIKSFLSLAIDIAKESSASPYFAFASFCFSKTIYLAGTDSTGLLNTLMIDVIPAWFDNIPKSILCVSVETRPFDLLYFASFTPECFFVLLIIVQSPDTFIIMFNFYFFGWGLVFFVPTCSYVICIHTMYRACIQTKVIKSIKSIDLKLFQQNLN